jgi:hypothetical protein
VRIIFTNATGFGGANNVEALNERVVQPGRGW